MVITTLSNAEQIFQYHAANELHIYQERPSKPKCLNMIAESDNKYIVNHTKMNQSSSKHYMLVCLFAWWCLRPLSTLFQLYRGGMFYWWRKPEDPEKTNDLSFVRQSLSHNVVHLGLIEIPTHNIGGDRHWLHR
jgi:hypothetical protein